MAGAFIFLMACIPKSWLLLDSHQHTPPASFRGVHGWMQSAGGGFTFMG